MSAAVATLATCCAKSVMLYLDGEVEPARVLETEAHIASCVTCREQLEFAKAMRTSLKRTVLGTAPAGMAERLRHQLVEQSAQQVARAEDDINISTTRALHAFSGVRPGVGLSGVQSLGVDALEVSGVVEGRAPVVSEPAVSRRWAVAAALLAACFVVAVVVVQRGREGVSQGLLVALTGPHLSPSSSAARAAVANDVVAKSDDLARLDEILDRLVAHHANPLPPEERNPQALTRFEPYVGVPVRKSALMMLRGLGSPASFDGARIHPIKVTRGEDGKNCAALQYKMQGHRLTVYMFDPRLVPLTKTRLQPRRVANDSVYVGKVRGFSVAATEKRGVGYALASDLDEDRSIQMVASF